MEKMGGKVHSSEICGNVSWLKEGWIMSVFSGYSDQVDNTPLLTWRDPTTSLLRQLHGEEWFNMTTFFYIQLWLTYMKLVAVESGWVWSADSAVNHNKTWWRLSSYRIDHVCFLGGSHRQVNGTPQKGFVRPEQLLEGKVSWVLEESVCVCVRQRNLINFPPLCC